MSKHLIEGIIAAIVLLPCIAYEVVNIAYILMTSYTAKVMNKRGDKVLINKGNNNDILIRTDCKKKLNEYSKERHL